MNIHTALDLGLTIRDRRRRLALTQAQLAAVAGVGRQWLNALEHGKAGAELGLVLRTLVGLGLSLSINEDSRPGPATTGNGVMDLDKVIDAHRRPGR